MTYIEIGLQKAERYGEHQDHWKAWVWDGPEEAEGKTKSEALANLAEELSEDK